MDLSAHFAREPLAARLRRLADLAEEAEIADPDVYGSAPALQAFETEVAELLGKRAAAFFPTGTLAQRAALHAHAEQLAEPKGRVILHPTSHLAHHDCLRDGEAQAKRARAEAVGRLPQFTVEFAGDFHRAMTLADCTAPSLGGLRKGDVLVVELPQRMNGGRAVPWDDLQALAAGAREAGARLHMDGARLWEVQPFYGRPFKEVCAPFQSVYVSFYKGLGGLSGAMLCGDADFIALGRQWRERLGGSVFSLAPAWIDAQAQFRQCVGAADHAGFELRFRKLREVVHALSEDGAVRRVLRFEPAEPQACLVHGYVQGAKEDLEAAHAHVLRTKGVKLWNNLRGRGYPASPSEASVSGEEVYFEWNMGPANAALPTASFLEAWQAFAEELARASAASGEAFEHGIKLSGNKFVMALDEEGHQAHLEFEVQRGDGAEIMDMRHTFVPPEGRGRNVAAKLCGVAFEHCKAKGMRVRPSCSYISGNFLKKNADAYGSMCVRE